MHASRPSEAQLQSALEHWFSALANADAEGGELDGLLSTPDLEFAPLDQTQWHRSALVSWLAMLRSAHARVAYSIAKLHVDELDGGSFRVHFEVDRETVDDEGMLHVMRREQSLQLQRSMQGRLFVLDIKDEPRLAFPGSGPQIVCY